MCGRGGIRVKGDRGGIFRAARAFIGEFLLCSDVFSISDEGLSVTPPRRSAGGFG